MTQDRERRRAFWIAAAIFFVALVMRLLWVTVPINIDEAVWIRRGPAFYVALLTSDPTGTYLKHHPGVTNMWIIGAGLSLRYGLRGLLPPDALVSQSAGLIDYLRAVTAAPVTPLSAYTAARWASAFVTASSLAALYLLSRKVYGATVALTAAVILLLEPFFVAYQRSITTDANQTNFMWISFLALLIYAGIWTTKGAQGREEHEARRARSSRDSATWWLLISGLFFGLAVLSKVTNVLTLPAFALVGLAAAWQARAMRSWLRFAGDALLWGGITIVVALALWPALRVDPLGTLSIWYSGLSSEVAGHDQFLLGHYTRNPGPLYYPIVLVARLSPLLLIGAIWGVIALLAPGLRRHFTHRRATWAALLLTAVILLGVSLFDSKHDRYIVPMIPGLALTATGGVWAGVRAWQARRGETLVGSSRALPLVMAAVIVAQLAVMLPHLPYYLSYFSPLVGGPRGAQSLVMVGNGELLDQAADWLEQNVPADARVGQRDYSASMAPYYAGRVQEIVMDPDTGAWPLPEMEYVVVYSNQLQRRFPANLVDYFAPQRPLHVVQWRGADYAKIYPGPAVRPEDRAALPNPSALDFGEYARLIGYDLETPEVAAGNDAILTLFWESLALFPADDFSVYVGMRDAQGNLYAHADTIPAGFFAPVNRWQTGQVLRDANLLRIPPGAPPGDYTLEAGFFAPSLDQALEIRDENGPRGNRIPLTQIRVTKPDQPSSNAADFGIANILPDPVLLSENGPQLLGYEWDAPTEVTAGEGIPVSLLWRAGKQTPPNTKIVARLTGPNGNTQRRNGHPLGGAYPAGSWTPGELVRDTWTALLPAGAPDGDYRLSLTAIKPDGEQTLLDLGNVTMRDRTHDLAAPTPTYASGVLLGDATRFAGFDAGGDATVCGDALCLPAGAPLELTLWWQAADESERNLARFLHVVDAEGRPVAQSDGQPGGYAATSWVQGETVRDQVVLDTSVLPVGSYGLVTGLYDRATDTRLVTPEGEDHIILPMRLEIR